MTSEYWNEWIAGRTWYARPMQPGDTRVHLVPTHFGDGGPLPEDFIEFAGEIGFYLPLNEKQ